MRLFRRRPAAPNPAASPLRLDYEDPVRDARRRVLILLVGVPADRLGGLIDLAERSLDAARDEAVVVVSDLDFAPLRQRALPFEYLPDAATLKPTDAAGYRDYVRRKLDLIRLKWAPAVELDMGTPIEVFLDDNAAPIAQRAMA